MHYFDMNFIPEKQLLEGAMLKTVYGEKIMLSFVDLEPGVTVPKHSHPHEQMGYIISGELAFDIGGEKKICRTGDAYLIPSGVSHSVKVSDDGPAKVLDIFSPPREEYK